MKGYIIITRKGIGGNHNILTSGDVSMAQAN